MPSIEQNQEIDRIRHNIALYGFHSYTVAGGDPCPRYSYTIGLAEKVGFELLLAGAIEFLVDDVKAILKELAQAVTSGWRSEAPRNIGVLGEFRLREVHHSWSSKLMTGAHHFYKTANITTMQIVPDELHWTVDIPNLEKRFDPKSEPIWQWLHTGWCYPVSESSLAVTNLAALKGAAITEAARWEIDQWELFAGAGPDVDPSDVRVVPLGTMLGADATLAPIVQLSVGSAIWRLSKGADWQKWK